MRFHPLAEAREMRRRFAGPVYLAGLVISALCCDSAPQLVHAAVCSGVHDAAAREIFAHGKSRVAARRKQGRHLRRRSLRDNRLRASRATDQPTCGRRRPNRDWRPLQLDPAALPHHCPRDPRRQAAGFKSEWAGSLVGIAHRPLHGRGWGGAEGRMNARRELGSVKDDEVPPQILVVEDEIMQRRRYRQRAPRNGRP